MMEIVENYIGKKLIKYEYLNLFVGKIHKIKIYLLCIIEYVLIFCIDKKHSMFYIF